MTSVEARPARLLEDPYFQVFALLTVISGIFTAHFILVRYSSRAPIISVSRSVWVPDASPRPPEPEPSSPPREQPAPRAVSAAPPTEPEPISRRLELPAPLAAPAAAPALSAPAAPREAAAANPRQPGAWVVDALKGPDADTATISAAIAGARDGDSITIRPGTYREALVLNKSVTLLGGGRRPSDTRVTSGGAVTVSVRGGFPVLKNLALANTAISNGSVVDVLKSRVSLQSVLLSSLGVGVRAREGEVEVLDSQLGAKVAVHAEARSRASVLGTTATGVDSVLSADGVDTELTVERSTIRDSRDRGVTVTHFARARLSDVQVSGNLGAAIHADSGADVRISRSALSSNGGCAVRAAGASLVAIAQTQVSRNRCGIQALGPATLDVTDSRFSDLPGGALSVSAGAKADLVLRGGRNTGFPLPSAGGMARRAEYE